MVENLVPDQDIKFTLTRSTLEGLCTDIAERTTALVSVNPFSHLAAAVVRHRGTEARRQLCDREALCAYASVPLCLCASVCVAALLARSDRRRAPYHRLAAY